MRHFCDFPCTSRRPKTWLKRQNVATVRHCIIPLKYTTYSRKHTPHLVGNNYLPLIRITEISWPRGIPTNSKYSQLRSILGKWVVNDKIIFIWYDFQFRWLLFEVTFTFGDFFKVTFIWVDFYSQLWKVMEALNRTKAIIQRPDLEERERLQICRFLEELISITKYVGTHEKWGRYKHQIKIYEHGSIRQQYRAPYLF